MACNAIAMTTAQLRGNRSLLTEPTYRDALLATVRNVTGSHAEAIRYSDLLYIQAQAGRVLITIADTGTTRVRIYDATATDDALIAHIDAALAALVQVIAQTRAAQVIATLLPVSRTQVDARGNITLEVSI